jgi:hypothetical protein
MLVSWGRGQCTALNYSLIGLKHTKTKYTGTKSISQQYKTQGWRGVDKSFLPWDTKKKEVHLPERPAKFTAQLPVSFLERLDIFARR